MKKVILWFFLSLFIFSSFSFAEKVLNMWEFLTVYFEGISQDMPESWKYIDVKYQNVKKNTPLYQSLQKGIYLDVFPNLSLELPWDKILKQEHMAKLLQAKTKKEFQYEKWKEINIERTKYMIEYSRKEYVGNRWLDSAQLILDYIIDRLNENYIFDKEIKNEELWYGAIKWYVDALWDPYTTFMPPNEAKVFGEELLWSFEWIGAQVEMKGAWIFVIVSPLKNSPAEKYWLKAGDIIVKVGNNLVGKNTNLTELVSWIKWPEWSFIRIDVKRNDEIRSLNIKREKIVLKNVEYELLSWQNCYIDIAQFNHQSAIQFYDAINFFENKSCNKYIMDLRNNPGGDLNVVTSILDYFVAWEEAIVTIKYKNFEENILANKNTKKIGDKNTIVLINEWSASASEVFAGVIKDYVKNSILLGKQSFGKWSVQSVIEYTDGSMLKYTIAKRLTGKSKTNIDWKWLKPDIEIDSNNSLKDEILEFAKNYKFK